MDTQVTLEKNVCKSFACAIHCLICLCNARSGQRSQSAPREAALQRVRSVWRKPRAWAAGGQEGAPPLLRRAGRGSGPQAAHLGQRPVPPSDRGSRSCGLLALTRTGTQTGNSRRAPGEREAVPGEAPPTSPSGTFLGLAPQLLGGSSALSPSAQPSSNCLTTQTPAL